MVIKERTKFIFEPEYIADVHGDIYVITEISCVHPGYGEEYPYEFVIKHLYSNKFVEVSFNALREDFLVTDHIMGFIVKILSQALLLTHGEPEWELLKGSNR